MLTTIDVYSALHDILVNDTIDRADLAKVTDDLMSLQKNNSNIEQFTKLQERLLKALTAIGSNFDKVSTLCRIRKKTDLI